jgi:hypothetical protein
MAGRRPVSNCEERQLLRVDRENAHLSPRNGLFGFRISEILSLTVGSVLRDEMVVNKIGVAPRHILD